jgi:hypothetical protein
MNSITASEVNQMTPQKMVANLIGMQKDRWDKYISDIIIMSSKMKQERKIVMLLIECMITSESQNLYKPDYVEYIACLIAKYSWSIDFRRQLRDACLFTNSIAGSRCALYVSMEQYSRYIPGTIINWCEKKWYDAIIWFPQVIKIAQNDKIAIICEIVECYNAYPDARDALLSLNKYLMQGLLTNEDYTYAWKMLNDIQDHK